MNLLVIGAGAIGSVYGHLASLPTSSGEKSSVTFFVKPKNRKNLENGITIYEWRGKKAITHDFKKFSVIDSFETLKTRNQEKPFDAVLITLPSDKLAAPGWLDGLFSSIGDAKVWNLSPNAKDREFIENVGKKQFGDSFQSRLVWGRIPIMSYLAPLPGESFEKTGYAYYQTPASRALWSSLDPTAAKEAANFFDARGLPSKAAPDFTKDGIFPDHFLRGIVAGLEKSEWSFDRLLMGPNLPLVTEGIREMTAIQSKSLGVSDPGAKWWGKLASSSFGIRKTLGLIQWMVPFDFEAFVRVHFTKVEEQMHDELKELIEKGKQLRLSTTSLVLLKGRARFKTD